MNEFKVKRFEVGDRVRYTGRVGTIFYKDLTSYAVDLEESGWYDGHTCDGKLPRNTGAWAWDVDLEPEKKEFLIYRRKK
jgi:hypothetical protein